MKKNLIGVVTDSAEGQELAKHLALHGFSVSMFLYGFENYTTREQADLFNDCGASGITVVPDTQALTVSLEVPRKLFVLSRTENFSNRVLKELLDALEAGDTLVNMCDMSYIEAGSLAEEQKKRGVNYMPTGFSGKISAGSGISILPGGPLQGYEAMRPVFAEIAASDESGFSACPYIGPCGAGQYVKMAANGLEYAMFELYAETISLIRAFCDVDTEDIAEILRDMGSTEAESRFLDIVTDVISRRDAETGKPMADIVIDRVEFGRSVQWLVKEAIDLEIPVASVSTALEMRFISRLGNERVAASRLVQDEPHEKISDLDRRQFLGELRNGMYLGCLVALTQCFSLLKKASDAYRWDLDLLAIARVLQVNSYSSSRSLNRVIDAYDRNSKLSNLFNDPYFRNAASNHIGSLRYVASLAVKSGIPMPAFCGALQYIDSYRNPSLGLGVLQLVRDYIHGSGFERNDVPGVYTANWDVLDREVRQKKLNG